MSASTGQGEVLVLEILDADRNSDIPGPLLPSLVAQLRSRGRSTTWWALGVPTPPYPEDGSSPLTYTLSPEDLAVLRARVASLKPEQVLVSRQLEADSLAALNALFGEGSVACTPRLETRRWLRERGGPPWLDELLSDLPEEQPLHRGVIPVFDREPLNALAARSRPYTHLYLGSECLYRKRIEANRFYKDLDLGRCVSDRGCTFCRPPYSMGVDLAEAPVERALEILQAARETTPEAFRSHEYQVHGIQLWHELGAFLPRFLALGAPPSSFYFSCRIDEVLANASVLEEHLPELARQGHRLLMGNIGLENFSPDENERFNKGLSAATLDRGIALLRRLEAVYPETFLFSAVGGFGFIMFSPWTRLEDLEQNIEGFRRNRVQMEKLHLSSAVQLLPDRAITLLAERDGLTVERFADRRFDSGCMTEWDDFEIPWRFQHPEVGSVAAISRRIMQPNSEPETETEDPLDAEVRAWVESVGGIQDDAGRLLQALVDSARAEPTAEPRRLMVLARERLPAWPPASSLPDSVEEPAENGASVETEPELSAAGETAAARSVPPQWRWLQTTLEEAFGAPAGLRGLAPLRLRRCEVVDADSDPRVRLFLRDGEACSLCIDVHRRREGEEAFLERGRWAVSYREAEGVDLPLITRACQEVLDTTGRALASIRRDRRQVPAKAGAR